MTRFRAMHARTAFHQARGIVEMSRAAGQGAQRFHAFTLA
jgi:hypothetical protein